MSHDNKVHSSQGHVPFSWENKPGVCKFSDIRDFSSKLGHPVQKLPPPPCPPESAKVSFHDLQVPLPPCGFQPSTRSSSKKGLIKKQEDPFLTAYREVTKSTRKGKHDVVGLGLRKNLSFISCKHSCSVRDDSMVRISKPPHPK
ncbi:hypothetical protein ACSBR2_029337 [Camellia fascicularis]